MNTIVIFGATSSIAQAFTLIKAKEGCELVLLARNTEKLAILKDYYTTMGASNVRTYAFNAATLTPQKAEQLVKDISSTCPLWHQVLIAHGDDKMQHISPQELIEKLAVNATSVVNLAEAITPKLIEQKQGKIAIISSVAGDRGRQSNYKYGAAKAMVTTYCSGWRAYMKNHNVHVITIKPGFVDTPMTADVKKNFLFASPTTVAKSIAKAIHNNQAVVYTPFFWRWIMLIIRAIPEPLFSKLKI